MMVLSLMLGDVYKRQVLILPIDRNAKRKTITGIVRDELGEPVVGASVAVSYTHLLYKVRKGRTRAQTR